MANIYNSNNYNNFKDTFLISNLSAKTFNLLDNFQVINYRGAILPRISLDPENRNNLINLIYSPIEDIYSNKKEKNIEIIISNEENTTLNNNLKDNIQINISKDLNSDLLLDEKKEIISKKKNNCLNNKEYLKKINFNLEPIPPDKFISIINNNNNEFNDKMELNLNNIKFINRIILNNINIISNYNNIVNNNPTIINKINNQKIYNLNFNIYTNNCSQNNDKPILNFSKPIFAVCYESDQVKKHSKRGRKPLFFKKNYRIHAASDDDNLLRKIQVHFFSFLINYVNDVIKTLTNCKKPPLFQKLDYAIKKNVNHKFIESLKSKKISEILQLKISPKIKIHDENANKMIYKKVCILCPFMNQFLNTSYISLFKEYFNNKNKLFFVNGKIIHISEKTKTFYDLMLNNINHKDKLKNLVNKFFLNTNIKK